MDATNTLSSLSPAQVQAQLSSWWSLMLLPVGGAVWHAALKAAPWATANGGLLRGVFRFFWVWGWTPAVQVTALPENPAATPA